MTVEAINSDNRTDVFAERLLESLNASSMTIMLSVGHRTGLLDTMAELAPSTSDEIADAAGLSERYVREWLAVMVTSNVVEYDPATATYTLPGAHAAVLTRAAGVDNIAMFAQYVGMLGSVEDRIVDCFHNGGGVPYEEFHRFHDVMAEESRGTVADALVDQILPLVPGLIERLEHGIDVVDVGCGRGYALATLAKAFPKSRFTGYDLSESAVSFARKKAEEANLTNLRYEQRDVASLDERGSFDLVTAFDAIHDQAKPAVVLSNIAGLLRSNGVFLMQDIAGSSCLEKNEDHPIAPFLYTISCMHCMTVSLAQDGEGLGTMWGEELAEQMLRDAGFSTISIERLSHDIQNCYYVARR